MISRFQRDVLAHLESARHDTIFDYRVCHGPKESKYGDSDANERILRHESIDEVRAS